MGGRGWGDDAQMLPPGPARTRELMAIDKKRWVMGKECKIKCMHSRHFI